MTVGAIEQQAKADEQKKGGNNPNNAKKRKYTWGGYGANLYGSKRHPAEQRKKYKTSTQRSAAYQLHKQSWCRSRVHQCALTPELSRAVKRRRLE